LTTDISELRRKDTQSETDRIALEDEHQLLIDEKDTEIEELRRYKMISLNLENNRKRLLRFCYRQLQLNPSELSDAELDGDWRHEYGSIMARVEARLQELENLCTTRKLV
jgi:hypothetical protein